MISDPHEACHICQTVLRGYRLQREAGCPMWWARESMRIVAVMATLLGLPWLLIAAAWSPERLERTLRRQWCVAHSMDRALAEYPKETS